MPIYEYRCSGCGSRFELLRRVSKASEDAECPRCHSSAERILSTFSAQGKDESGLATSVGGSSCASCGASGCTSCGG